jgi:hypothetical protein
MSVLAWLLPIAAFAFAMWCAYDFGKDVGYTRCWNEHHPWPSESPGNNPKGE